MSLRSTGKRVLLQGVGWVLVVLGVAALVLPGPGLLALFAGMALLATQYEWAERRLAPVREAALRGAADSVRSWPRILASALGVCTLVGLGVYWSSGAPAPSWWPVDDRWWLVGGWGTGATLIGSGAIALAMLVYSYLRFRRAEDEREAPGAVVRLVSGGQTGADRAALDVAVATGLAYGGWCPAGGWAEDRPVPPGVLADYPGLRATLSGDPAARTRLNVRDSDATLVVTDAPGTTADCSGTDLTVSTARDLGRPLLVSSGDVDEVRDWLRGLGPGLTLNVAGPRESERPGTYARTRALLGELLDALPQES